MTSPIPSTNDTATSGSPSTSTGSRSWDSRVLGVYLLLCSVYLLYWRHADFVLDDWFQFVFYRNNQARGWPGEMEVLRAIAQNKLYRNIQLYWASYWLDSILVWIVGYAPRFFFGLSLLLHATNGWLFYRLLLRLKVSPRLAYLTGAAFILIPTAHGPVFWFFASSYYKWGPLLLFLYLLSLVHSIEKRALTGRAVFQQLALMVLLVSGSAAPSFYLLLFAGPLMAVCFFPRDRWKVAAQATAIVWGLVAVYLAIYVLLINRTPATGTELATRYDFTYEFLVRNWRKFYRLHMPGISGFGLYYRIHASAAHLLSAALAALVVLAGQAFSPVLPEDRRKRLSHASRAALFAAGMIVLAYAPLVFLIGGTLRHYYTFSPYVSLLLATLCCTLPKGKTAAGALACAYFAACTVAEIQQCWTPMSRHMQTVKAGLLHLKNLQPGDRIVIPATPMVIGTAPTFALISGPWDSSFAEGVTGVKDLEFWREIVVERGRLRFYHRHAMRDTGAPELTRTHVLLGAASGPYAPARYLAEPLGPDQYRLHCLKDGDCPAPARVYTREQLRSRGGEIYFPKPFEHGNLHHLHY